jgi:hypothetical protein
MLGCLTIMYDVLNRITLNHTVRSQTKACTAKSLCAFSTLETVTLIGKGR